MYDFIVQVPSKLTDLIKYDINNLVHYLLHLYIGNIDITVTLFE